MMKNSSFILLLLFITHNCISQELTINGGSITLQGNSSLTVQGTLQNNANGTINNSGTVYINKNIINNGGNTLFVNNSAGTVELNGNNQFIAGNDSVVFYNLLLSGQPQSIKELYNNITVSNQLNLNEQELQIHNNNVHIVNPNATALVFNTGFVSGDTLGGYLYRTTNSSNVYTFQVGNNSLNLKTRPVLITPQNSNINVYGVRLSTNNLNYENTGSSLTGATGPFNTSNTDSIVDNLNEYFYHNIARQSGNSPAKIDIHFSSSDGDFNTVAQLVGNAFTQTGFVATDELNGSLDKKATSQLVSNFNHDIFVLANKVITIQVPAGVSVNNDGLNETLVIDNLEFYPNHQIQIYNRWGDLIYQTSNYNNDWNGQSTNALFGNEVTSGTYFYILILDDNIEPITGYIELKK